MGNVLSWAMRLVATVTFCVFSVFSWSEEPAALGTCIACHGKSGMAVSAEYPNLGGQYEDYLTLQLTNFRSGDRQNAVMNGIAAQLTDADIAALSAWFSAQPHHTQTRETQSIPGKEERPLDTAARMYAHIPATMVQGPYGMSQQPQIGYAPKSTHLSGFREPSRYLPEDIHFQQIARR